MTTQPSNIENIKHTEKQAPLPYGARLKTAREALGIDRKDAALKLNLSEKVILMMEKDRYPIDLPVTFIRGYLRAYSKMLQIPEEDVKKAIEPIKAKHTLTPNVASIRNFEPIEKNNYFMQIFTVVIVLTMTGLVSIWWYTHNSHPRIPLISQLSETISKNGIVSHYTQRLQNNNQTTHSDSSPPISNTPSLAATNIDSPIATETANHPEVPFQSNHDAIEPSASAHAGQIDDAETADKTSKSDYSDATND